MREHTWIVKEITGGPEGGGDFWLCTTCGCSGGDADNYRKGRLTPRPFLPGPAIDLSQDCSIAHEQVMYFVRGYMRGWDRTTPKEAANVQELRSLMVRANKFTSQHFSRVDFYQLAWDCDEPLRRPTLGDVTARLHAMGFKTASPNCTLCGKPTERPAEDTNELCYTCDYKGKGGLPAALRRMFGEPIVCSGCGSPAEFVCTVCQKPFCQANGCPDVGQHPSKRIT